MVAIVMSIIITVITSMAISIVILSYLYVRDSLL